MISFICNQQYNSASRLQNCLTCGIHDWWQSHSHFNNIFFYLHIFVYFNKFVIISLYNALNIEYIPSVVYCNVIFLKNSLLQFVFLKFPEKNLEINANFKVNFILMIVYITRWVASRFGNTNILLVFINSNSLLLLKN